MENLKNEFQDRNRQNWIKSTHAITVSRRVIVKLLEVGVTELHSALLKHVFGVNSYRECNSCFTENVVPCASKHFCIKYSGGRCNTHKGANKQPRQCPLNVCDKLYSTIVQWHRHRSPTWKNTKAERWCTDAWEIAKCFCPENYQNKTVSDIDFTGLLSFFLNCTFFHRFFGQQSHIITENIKKVTNKFITKVEYNAIEIDFSILTNS